MVMKMNDLTILGSSGMLGSACALAMPEATKPTRKEFDALNEIPKFSGWVVNCVGAIPQRVSEDNLMRKLNVDFPISLGAGDAKVIQIATDCVFSGADGNYTESSPKDPVDEYGRTKLAGESARSLKIRCSIIGPDKTSASLFEWVRQQPEGATIYGYADHFWNGVSTFVFAKLAKGIVDTQFWENSTYHFVPRNFVSKFELVTLIAKHTNRSDLNIVKKNTGHPVNRTLATDYPNMNQYFWELAGYTKIPTIQDIVEEIPF
jgi:dTDP-4-dehydrorhamnose reductase